MMMEEWMCEMQFEGEERGDQVWKTLLTKAWLMLLAKAISRTL